MAYAAVAKRADSSVKKEKSKDEKSLDNFLLTITCPICLHYYREPVNFPLCPHTLCRECMQNLKPISALNPEEFECPNCRTINRITKNSVLPVNSVIRQIVEMVEIQEKKDVNKGKSRPCTPLKASGEGEDDDKCIHYLFPLSNKEKCPHCDMSFCEPCRFVHAEKLKQKLAVLRQKWESEQLTASSSSDINNLYSGIANKFNDQVRDVKEQVSNVIESIIGKVRSALNEKAQIIIAEADSFRSEQLNTVNRIIEASRSHDAVCEKIDVFLKKSILETGLQEAANLTEQAFERELDLKMLNLLKSNQHNDKIVFAPDDKNFDFSVKDFVDNVDIGWVHIDGDQLLIRNPSDSSKAGEIAKDEVENFDEEGEEGELSDMVILSSLKLEDCNIKQPIGMLALPNSDYFVIADSRSFLAVFRARGDKLCAVCTLSICDPDVNKANFRQYLSGEMAADDTKLYLIDADQRRILNFPIPWAILENLKTSTRRSLNTTKLFARSDLVYRDLVINSNRSELYTMEGQSLLAYCTLNGTLKFQSKFEQNARILAAHNSFGFILSRDDGTVCVKSQANDGTPVEGNAGEIYFSENDFDDGLNAERFSSTITSGQVDVDAKGTVYFAEHTIERLAVCSHVDSDDNDEDFNSWIFKTASNCSADDKEEKKKRLIISVKPSAVVALSENSISELPNLSVVAVIDSTTGSVLLMKLELSE